MSDAVCRRSEHKDITEPFPGGSVTALCLLSVRFIFYRNAGAVGREIRGSFRASRSHRDQNCCAVQTSSRLMVRVIVYILKGDYGVSHTHTYVCGNPFVSAAKTYGRSDMPSFWFSRRLPDCHGPDSREYRYAVKPGSISADPCVIIITLIFPLRYRNLHRHTVNLRWNIFLGHFA